MHSALEDPIGRSRARWAWIGLALTCFFLLADRWLVLHQFGFRYVDDDQAIMWSGAVEMAHGRFHEPCFYGQRYNTMLEGLVAVPLLWCGIGPEIALPLITSCLALFPFVLLAYLLMRRGSLLPAAVVLALPVTLPPEYGMISTLPRGFVTGVFLASMAVLPLFSRRGLFLLLAPFFAILALFANPNAAIVLVPLAILILLHYRTEPRCYLLGLAGAVPAALLYYGGHRFYDLHPNYEVHSLVGLDFGLAGLRALDFNYMDPLSPILWGKGALVVLLLVGLVVVLWRNGQGKAAVALAIGVLFLLASFGVTKVHDGTPSVYYPWARMFLAVPFLLALFLAQLKIQALRWAIALVPLVAACFFGYKCVVQSDAVQRQVKDRETKGIEFVEVEELRRHCAVFDGLARDHDPDLLVVSWGRYKHLTNYGCPCLYPRLPKTFAPALDRRTWLLRSIAADVAANVLFTGYAESDLSGPHDPFVHVAKVSEEPLVFLVKGNTQRTDSLFANLRLFLRPH